MILYLDFDGVLHPDDVVLDACRRPYLRGPGALFEHADYLDAVLSPYPQIAIVLSTSWVRVKSFSYARKRLPARLRQRVIGATWHSHFARDEELLFWWLQRASRYHQIASDVSRRQPAHWLAIDDDADGWPVLAQPHLIRSDPLLGMGAPDVRRQLEERLAAEASAHPKMTNFKSIL